MHGSYAAGNGDTFMFFTLFGSAEVSKYNHPGPAGTHVLVHLKC